MLVRIDSPLKLPLVVQRVLVDRAPLTAVRRVFDTVAAACASAAHRFLRSPVPSPIEKLLHARKDRESRQAVRSCAESAGG